MWLDVMELRSGHSLILNNLPDLKDAKPDFAHVGSGTPVDRESFGLFSSPDFNKFYPGVKQEDLKPNSEDFIEPVYRALSEVIVHKNWNPVDFGENGVLKKSMSLLKGQAVKGDHEGGIHTSMGAVNHVVWEESYKQNGIQIPAGINARFKIDAKANPRIARGIQMDPPSIHSCSVTVSFLWDKSHPSMDQNEFLSKLGTYDKDGKMIRRVATLIKNYHEISLVDHGADPFAKKKTENGNIVLPEHANTVYNSWKAEKHKDKNDKFFFFDFKDIEAEDIISNTGNPTIPAPSNEETQTSNTDNMKEHLIALATIFGLTFDETKPESATALIEAVKKAKTDLETAQNTVTELQAAKPDEAVLTKLKDFQKNTLASARAAAIASLQKLHDNQAPKSLVDVIENLDNLEGIAALKGSYDDQLDKKFPLACKKCNSTEVSRASATAKPEGEEAPKVEALSAEQVRNKLIKEQGNMAFNF